MEYDSEGTPSEATMPKSVHDLLALTRTACVLIDQIKAIVGPSGLSVSGNHSDARYFTSKTNKKVYELIEKYEEVMNDVIETNEPSNN